MKKITMIATALVLATSTMAYAGDDHKHSDGMAMSMSSDMSASMKSMKADMKKIQQEKDPAKRKSMMKTHMKGMSAMMSTMKGDKNSMMGKDHMDKMSKMETRISMLEAMMEQVVVSQVILSAPDSVFVWDEAADEYQLR
ncbi:hypothetical protein [sulfur-oxidizing endosymbiont of Gigantopelta aegis]|uniref:hypothetical protein n=1 Tax=sulfur-oxidizing endosymbiont of Gigantopelta aegis TaxID=2794934 RepID=UPI0018DE5208|nr:hypothetical protein [sulfur-oxidizing endosymbiont of Gigantopelta aegis]